MAKIKKKTLTGAELKQSRAWWKKQDKKRAMKMKKQKAEKRLSIISFQSL